VLIPGMTATLIASMPQAREPPLLIEDFSNMTTSASGLMSLAEIAARQPAAPPPIMAISAGLLFCIKNSFFQKKLSIFISSINFLIKNLEIYSNTGTFFAMVIIQT
jgi:hypothetical protein